MCFWSIIGFTTTLLATLALVFTPPAGDAIVVIFGLDAVLNSFAVVVSFERPKIKCSRFDEVRMVLSLGYWMGCSIY